MNLQKTYSAPLVWCIDQVHLELVGYSLKYKDGTVTKVDNYEDLKGIDLSNVIGISQIGAKRKKELPELYKDAREIYSLNRTF